MTFISQARADELNLPNKGLDEYHFLNGDQTLNRFEILPTRKTSTKESQKTARAAHSQTENYQYAVGVNYPGVNIRKFFGDGSAAEIKGQYMDKIGVAGLRIYIYLSETGRRLKFYGGVEGDYLTFKGNVSKGAGGAIGGFGGFEYFFSRRLSLLVDMGPAYINLKDTATSLTSHGIYFVVNSGVNLYF
jgi:hypothetical protein